MNAIMDQIVLEGCIVPAPWLFEVANGIVDGYRRGRLNAEQQQLWSTKFKQLPTITVDTPDRDFVFNQISKLAQQHRLSVYDASYLELAIRNGIPLVTFDTKLRTAAEAAGIEVKP